MKKNLQFVLILLICTFSLSLKAQFSEEEQVQKLEKIGENAVKKQVSMMRNDIKNGSTMIGEDGRYRVSTDIIIIKDIDEEVKRRIEGRKIAIKEIIYQTARDIESNQNTNIAFENNILSKKEQEEVKTFYNAINENNISLSSLALSIKMVVGVSKDLYNAAFTETDPKRKSNLYIEYTAFAYELSNIVVSLLENFEQQGIDELNSLYTKQKQEVDAIKGRINNKTSDYERRYKSGQLTKTDYYEKVNTHSDLLIVLDKSLEQWTILFETIDKQKDWASNIQTKVQDFRDLRDEAGLQLDVLAVIKTTLTVLENFKNIEEITEIAKVPLLPINIELVNDLFRTELPKDIEKNKIKLN